jgi:hypothetical protein
MSLREFFLGRPARMDQVPMFTPEQTSTMNQLRGMGMQGLQQGMNFEPIADKMREGFNQQTIPSLAERFAGAGAMGSSRFAQSLGQQGRGLETDIGGMRSQWQQNMLPQYQSMLGAGLHQQFANQPVARQPGYPELSFTTAMSLLPQILGAVMGNPAAAAGIPNTIGQGISGLSGLFSGGNMGGMNSSFSSPVGGFGSQGSGYNPFSQFRFGGM